MNKSLAIALAAASVFASTGAFADEADASQYAHQFTSTRARADVQAEAVQKANTFSPEPAGSRIAAPLKSDTARSTVQGDAAVALQRGAISYGEVGGRQG